ncbi:MAG: DUF2179 domain-containing protein [Bacteroidia bacterium]|nr:DUF2179 domain-containing protein [Bacteroidia bacterium]
MDFDWYGYIVLPLLIVCSRLFDVTLGTIRHVFIARGFNKLVPLLGFFEVLIWIIVVRQVMNGMESWPAYIAWAGGFALGNYFGLIIEQRLALGMQIVRIITHQASDDLVRSMREMDHGVTIMDAQGAKGPVKVIFTIVKRESLNDLEDAIAIHQPNAFYSVEDVKDASMGVFRSRKERNSVLQLLRRLRKGK